MDLVMERETDGTEIGTGLHGHARAVGLGPGRLPGPGRLERPHVARWFGAVRNDIETQARLSPESTARIVVDGHPVGLLCWQRLAWNGLDGAWSTDLDGDLVDIDIFIAQVEALGRGVGPAALGLTLERLRSAAAARYAGVGSSVSNERVIRAHRKAGFLPWREYADPERGAALYLVADLRAANQREHRSNGGCDESS